ncbi:hypothetical protein [Corynebacterium sp. CCM 9204]
MVSGVDRSELVGEDAALNALALADPPALSVKYFCANELSVESNDD